MKKITFLLFMSLSFSFFGQDKLTSSINEYFDGTEWKNGGRVTYSYDANNNLINETYYSWSGDANWAINGKQTNSFNNFGKIIENVYENINSATGIVVDGFKTIYTYNSAQQITVITNQQLSNGVWINDTRSLLSYSNNKISLLIGESWNGSSWEFTVDSSQNDGSSRVTVNYGANGLSSEFIYEVWDGSGWSLESKEIYTYNTNNKNTQQISQDWNGTAYTNSSKIEKTYDSNNNLILEKEFDFTNGIFTSNYEESYTFDTSQLMSSITNPFTDTTGFDALSGNDNNFVNKIVTSSTGSNDRTTYYYNGATASIKEFTNLNFRAYPNPSSNEVTINVGNKTLKSAALYSILGNKILSTESNKIVISNLSKGIYLLKVFTLEGDIASKKIIKN